MLIEQIEHRWLAAFERTFALCKIQEGDVVALLTESQSRRVNVDLARLSLQRMGAKMFEVCLPTPALSAPAPVRSTGATDVIQHLAPVVAALQRANVVIDCTVEGMLHAPELPTILKGAEGVMPRLFMISNEHPEILERTVPDPALEAERAAIAREREQFQAQQQQWEQQRIAHDQAEAQRALNDFRAKYADWAPEELAALEARVNQSATWGGIYSSTGDAYTATA